jgi:hypothetical protein
LGFTAVGISNLDGLRDLPYGKTDYVGVLKMPEQELKLALGKATS